MEMRQRISDTLAENWLQLGNDEMKPQTALYLADAVLAAMHEPTEAMLHAGDNWESWPSADDVWQAMIDAASTDAARGETE